MEEIGITIEKYNKNTVHVLAGMWTFFVKEWMMSKVWDLREVSQLLMQDRCYCDIMVTKGISELGE